MTGTAYSVDTSSPVLVTGATGYVAGWIVKRLLDAGVTVHACVRDPENSAKVGHLTALADSAPGTLKLFRSDLLQDGSFAGAMAGCSVVFHTASPFTLNVRDPQKHLIDPAVGGTRNVLQEAARSQSVSRVVLTSSCAAIYCDAQDTLDAPGGRITEAVWNSTASLGYQPYSLSKTLAEQAAWQIAKAQDRWRLVVINPSLVVGPSVQSKPTSESFNLMRMLGSGALKMGAPRFGFGAVDVREVAEAHLAAAFLPAAEGRHIVSGHATDLLEMGRLLRDRFGRDYPLPQRALPKWLVWMAAPAQGLDRRYVRRTVNVPFRADNAKSIAALGMTYRPLRDSLEEMFAKMVEDGWFKRS